MLKDLISLLDKYETELRSLRVQTFFHRQSEEHYENFLAYREELCILKNRLSKIDTGISTAKFNRLLLQLKSKIDIAQQSLSVLHNSSRIIQDLASVLDFLSRLVTLSKSIPEVIEKNSDSNSNYTID